MSSTIQSLAIAYLNQYRTIRLRQQDRLQEMLQGEIDPDRFENLLQTEEKRLALFSFLFPDLSLQRLQQKLVHVIKRLLELFSNVQANMESIRHYLHLVTILFREIDSELGDAKRRKQAINDAFTKQHEDLEARILDLIGESMDHSYENHRLAVQRHRREVEESQKHAKPHVNPFMQIFENQRLQQEKQRRVQEEIAKRIKEWHEKRNGKPKR